MRRVLAIVSLTLALVLLAAAGTALAAALISERQAARSADDALRLRAAQVEVARAQRTVGSGDIEGAIGSIRRANTIAVRIDRLTSQILGLLSPTARSVAGTISLARRAARNAAQSRRLTQAVSGALAAIAAYQQSASSYGRITNRALRKILLALRRTNRSFPPR